ncbi:MAG: prepilin peptidase [Alphaproteobacteria bacterium]|nr:prepilin peptidase [Alphaproteobacteria bacterium]
MLNSLLILAPFVLLLLLAAGWDLASYTIPNFISAAMVVAFFLFAVTAGYSLGQYQSHLLAGFIALIAGFTLFALGYIGGGDAKFFAGVAAWFGLHDLLPYVVTASLFGGALTLGLLALRRFPLPAALCAQTWIVRLHEPRGGIPYGVALAAGGMAVLPYTELFRPLSF